MFTVEMLPALEGDCIWVEWGEPHRPHRMLIDAGRADGKRIPTALRTKIEALPPDQRTFDLVVATHIDVDHVHGLVPLFATPPDGFRARQVWFNGRRHLPPADRRRSSPPVGLEGSRIQPEDQPDGDQLGYKDGNRLTEALEENAPYAWNRTWTDSPNGAVVVTDPPDALPRRDVGGLEIVLLSPTLDALSQLIKKWPETVRAAGLDPTSEPEVADDRLGGPRDMDARLRDLAKLNDDDDDPSPSNRTSIAFLATYDGKTVLFGADAHADVLTAGLGRVSGGSPVHVDVCKVPHHGSRQNVKPELLKLLDCNTWLVSTNGSRHYHPDRRAMARLLTTGEGQRLVFNYVGAMTEEYGRFVTTNEFQSAAHYPASTQEGIRIDVSPVIASRGGV